MNYSPYGSQQDFLKFYQTAKKQFSQKGLDIDSQIMKRYQPTMSEDEILQRFDNNFPEFKKMEQQQSQLNIGFNQTILDKTKKKTYAKISDLDLITVRKMKVGSVHYGKFIKVQFVRNCYKMVAIHGVVKDISGQGLCAIAIYNFPLSNKHYDNFFRKGVVISIKQPYYKSSNGYLNIRIDDPYDIDFIVDNLNGDHFKKIGNKSFSQKQYVDALIHYQKALEIETEPQKIAILRANNSICFLNVNLPHDALRQAQKCLQIDPKSKKANYRKILSLIELNQQDEARYAIQMSKNLLSVQQISFVQQKFDFRKDCATGIFDWAKIFKLYQIQQYESQKITVKKSKKIGSLGVFCKQNIQENEIILVQKPIIYDVYKVKNNKWQEKLFFQIDLMNKNIESNNNDTKIRSQLQYLYDKSEQMKKKISTLFCKNTANLTYQKRKKRLTTQIGQVKQKYIQNRLYASQFCEIANSDLSNSANGLWQKMSLFNHSCTPNADYFILNKSAVVMSIAPIKKDEEIFIRYSYDIKSLKSFGVNCQNCNTHKQKQNKNIIDQFDINNSLCFELTWNRLLRQMKENAINEYLIIQNKQKFIQTATINVLAQLLHYAIKNNNKYLIKIAEAVEYKIFKTTKGLKQLIR